MRLGERRDAIEGRVVDQQADAHQQQVDDLGLVAGLRDEVVEIAQRDRAVGGRGPRVRRGAEGEQEGGDKGKEACVHGAARKGKSVDEGVRSS